MFHIMSNLRKLKVRCYTARMFNINKYVSVLPQGKIIEKVCRIEFNEVMLNSIPNLWSKKDYVQGFNWETMSKNL